MNFAIILAAGKGQRYGSKKQFAILKDKPVIYYSLQKFNQSRMTNKIIVVTLTKRIPFIKQLVKKYKFTKVSNIIAGGKERQDSVANALKLLPNHGFVAIHDAVRPMITHELIKRGYKLAKREQACIPVIPLQDTVKEIKDDSVTATLNRSNLYHVQTPQFFNINLLKKAYIKAKKEKYYATDDANLVERLGHKVYTFAGLKQNMKITDKTDLKIISSILCNG